MSENKDQYHVSLFRGTSEYGKRNRRIILSMIAIWALAVFGFQILLRVIEKPVPEETLTQFESAWPGIAAGNADDATIRLFVTTNLKVLGKLAVTADHKAILSQAASWGIYQLVPDSLQVLLTGQLNAFSSLRESMNKLKEEQYDSARMEYKRVQEKLIITVAGALGIPSDGLEASMIPYFLTPEIPDQIDPDTREHIPGIMKKYLVHNRSFLTDAKFLGFPFHYFYTAEFLLFLFVFLCWAYNFRINRLNKRFNIVED